MQDKVKTNITHIILNGPVFTKKPFDPTLINFIYGTNGTGKSTISRILADKDYKGITFEGSRDDAAIMVYNEDYIRQSVQSYGNIPGVFTLSKENGDKGQEIEKAKAEKIRLEPKVKKNKEDLEQNQKNLEAREKKFVNDIWDTTMPIRDKYDKELEGFKGKKSKLSDAIKESLTNSQPSSHTDEELDKLYDLAHNDTRKPITPYHMVDFTIVDPSFPDLLKKNIVSVSQTPYAEFLKATGNSDWVLRGFRTYQQSAGNRCPYCGRKFTEEYSLEHFKDDLAKVFDTTYETAISELKKKCTDYQTKTSRLISALKDQTAYEGELQQDYMQHVLKVEQVISENNKLLDEKIKAPATSVEIVSLSEDLETLNEIITQINFKIKEYNSLLADSDKKKANSKTAVWEQMAYLCQTIYAEYNGAMEELTRSKEKLDEEKEKLDEESGKLDEKIADLNKQTVNTTEAKDNINALLRGAGFQGFEVVEKPGTSFVYQILRKKSDGTSEIAENLSEGERNFIAFLYFYQTVIGNQSDDGKEHNKIVVIDDPVSSMDSSTLYLVATLIRNLIDICYRNFELSESTDRHDYIKQFFCLTHNPYFFKEITYKWQDKYECVSLFQLKKGLGNQSDITECTTTIQADTIKQMINYTPVRNEYDALWTEFLTTADSMIAMSTARRILDFYFIQTCGQSNLRDLIDDHRDDFIDYSDSGNVDDHRYNLAKAMVSYLDSPALGFNSGIFFDSSTVGPDQYREVFKDIFESLHQGDHYRMMVSRIRGNDRKK